MNRPPPIFPRSSILVLEPNSIQSLVPSTVASQLESLLESHRLEDAHNLADQRRKKLEESIEIDEDEAEELRYVYQRIGFQCFTETLFEDAGKQLFNGELDPRLLISYYPDLRGSLFCGDDAMEVFSGVAEQMPDGSVDDIIVSNLVSNYSPHMVPSTLQAPPTAELRKILGMAAREMLVVFLKKNRIRRSVARGKGVRSSSHPVDIAIDTVLVKLYAEFEQTQNLYALLRESNDVSIPEVEPVLQKFGQYNALCMLYRQHGSDLKVIDVLAKLIDGTWTDDDLQDPLSQMTSLLTETRDKLLIQHWGVWLININPDAGMNLLKSRDNSKRREKPEEDIALLEQIEAANPAAGIRYLEYLVLQKRSTSRELHTKLASSCVDKVLSFLKDNDISKLWRAKASFYSSSGNNSSFLSYFASTTPSSEHKRARLSTIFVLSGSSLYDLETIRGKLRGWEKILDIELAIIEGKLGHHKSALRILVQNLNDSTSAETYCALGGHIVPAMLAQSIAEDNNLLDWTAIFFGIPSISKGTNGRGSNTANKELKKGLLKILLEVYMEIEQSDRAAQLMNNQAINLDILEVISLAPDKWPVAMMSSFLSRSFQRTLHSEKEGKIIKSIAESQNLEVKDKTWKILHQEDAFIEEEADDDDDTTDDDGEPQSFNEKTILVNQVAMHVEPLELKRASVAEVARNGHVIMPSK